MSPCYSLLEILNLLLFYENDEASIIHLANPHISKIGPFFRLIIISIVIGFVSSS